MMEMSKDVRVGRTREIMMDPNLKLYVYTGGYVRFYKIQHPQKNRCINYRVDCE